MLARGIREKGKGRLAIGLERNSEAGEMDGKAGVGRRKEVQGIDRLAKGHAMLG